MPVQPTEEPDAVSREIAKSFRNLFTALVHEGFTEPQALQLIGTAISAAIHGASGND